MGECLLQGCLGILFYISYTEEGGVGGKRGRRG